MFLRTFLAARQCLRKEHGTAGAQAFDACAPLRGRTGGEDTHARAQKQVSWAAFLRTLALVSWSRSIIHAPHSACTIEGTGGEDTRARAQKQVSLGCLRHALPQGIMEYRNYLILHAQLPSIRAVLTSDRALDCVQQRKHRALHMLSLRGLPSACSMRRAYMQCLSAH